MQSSRRRPRLDDDAFRDALRGIVERSGGSLRSLSLGMRRDPGYLAALLDPSRPSRARPTPDDLVALSDTTGIPLVELLEALWAIPADRLAAEVAGRDRGNVAAASRLTPADQRLLRDFTEFLATRPRAGRQPPEHG